MRTNAIVVEISRSPVPSSWDWNVSSGGTGERLVHALPALRQIAAERFPALLQVRDLRRVVGRLVERDVGTSSSEISSSKRSRKARRASSFIFFCWWVMFWPSPASPMP